MSNKPNKAARALACFLAALMIIGSIAIIVSALL